MTSPPLGAMWTLLLVVAAGQSVPDAAMAVTTFGESNRVPLQILGEFSSGTPAQNAEQMQPTPSQKTAPASQQSALVQEKIALLQAAQPQQQAAQVQQTVDGAEATAKANGSGATESEVDAEAKEDEGDLIASESDMKDMSQEGETFPAKSSLAELSSLTSVHKRSKRKAKAKATNLGSATSKVKAEANADGSAERKADKLFGAPVSPSLEESKADESVPLPPPAEPQGLLETEQSLGAHISMAEGEMSAIELSSTAEGRPHRQLPQGWKEAEDPKTGRTYYYNKATSQRTWQRPQEDRREFSADLPYDELQRQANESAFLAEKEALTALETKKVEAQRELAKVQAERVAKEKALQVEAERAAKEKALQELAQVEAARQKERAEHEAEVAMWREKAAKMAELEAAEAKLAEERRKLSGMTASTADLRAAEVDKAGQDIDAEKKREAEFAARQEQGEQDDAEEAQARAENEEAKKKDEQDEKKENEDEDREKSDSERDEKGEDEDDSDDDEEGDEDEEEDDDEDESDDDIHEEVAEEVDAASPATAAAKEVEEQLAAEKKKSSTEDDEASTDEDSTIPVKRSSNDEKANEDEESGSRAESSSDDEEANADEESAQKEKNQKTSSDGEEVNEDEESANQASATAIRIPSGGEDANEDEERANSGKSSTEGEDGTANAIDSEEKSEESPPTVDGDAEKNENDNDKDDADEESFRKKSEEARQKAKKLKAAQEAEGKIVRVMARPEKTIGMRVEKAADNRPRVAKVKRKTAAKKAGLKPGMLITHVADHSVKDYEDFQRSMRIYARPFEIRYLDDGTVYKNGRFEKKAVARPHKSDTDEEVAEEKEDHQDEDEEQPIKRVREPRPWPWVREHVPEDPVAAWGSGVGAALLTIAPPIAVAQSFAGKDMGRAEPPSVESTVALSLLVSFCYAAALGLLFPLLPGLTGPVENAGWVLPALAATSAANALIHARWVRPYTRETRMLVATSLLVAALAAAGLAAAVPYMYLPKYRSFLGIALAAKVVVVAALGGANAALVCWSVECPKEIAGERTTRIAAAHFGGFAVAVALAQHGPPGLALLALGTLVCAVEALQSMPIEGSMAPQQESEAVDCPVFASLGTLVCFAGFLAAVGPSADPMALLGAGAYVWFGGQKPWNHWAGAVCAAAALARVGAARFPLGHTGPEYQFVTWALTFIALVAGCSCSARALVLVLQPRTINGKADWLPTAVAVLGVVTALRASASAALPPKAAHQAELISAALLAVLTPMVPTVPEWSHGLLGKEGD